MSRQLTGQSRRGPCHASCTVSVSAISESSHFSSRTNPPSIHIRPGGVLVKQLIAYLLDHAIIDFSGDLTLDMVRDFLREDDSPEGRKLLGKLVEDRGVDDMVVTLARSEEH